jgi:hypothetical protein
MRPALPALALFAIATACAPEVPAEPTWVDDVRPILAANCIRCHSAPPIGGAPTFMRLDRYGDEVDPDTQEVAVSGAAGYAITIASHTALGLMPPRYPLTDRQVNVLEAWFVAGAPRGGPRPGNRDPIIELDEAPAPDDAGRVIMRYDISDPDGDLVVGVLRAEPDAPGQSSIVISNELVSGRGRVVWRSATAVPGRYTLVAELEDGDEPIFVDLGEVEVIP